MLRALALLRGGAKHRAMLRSVGAGRALHSAGARGMPRSAPTSWERHGVNRTPQFLPKMR